MDASTRQLLKQLKRALRGVRNTRPVVLPVVIAPSFDAFLLWCIDHKATPSHHVYAHRVEDLYRLYRRSLKDLSVVAYPDGAEGDAMRCYVHAMTKRVDEQPYAV